MVKKMSPKSCPIQKAKRGKTPSTGRSSSSKTFNEVQLENSTPSGRRLFSPRTWFTPKSMKVNHTTTTPKKVIKRTRKSKKMHNKFLIFRLCSTIGNSAVRMTRAIIGGRKKHRRNRSKKVEVSPSRWSRVAGIFRLRRAVECTPRSSKKLKSMKA